ncbi:hypothetical protein [[Clostridium] innocuum]|uniref:hypothetical protein n=1 Tax=Clostridium innocuum TaxID=1522 RepID=UPI000D6B8114|nr:hypothetical protein [[Clostridium] innocuum]PWJ12060.1 hypothetical protein ATF84_115108 [[Clostridium] innocuum]SSA47703.1 hypothetical protein SAMN04487929_115108 [[Clostridium] innocuum]
MRKDEKYIDGKNYLDFICNLLLDAKRKNKIAYVEVTIPNQSNTAFILHSPETIDTAIKNYKKRYDDNGCQNACRDIVIERAGVWENRYEEITQTLIDNKELSKI